MNERRDEIQRYDELLSWTNSLVLATIAFNILYWLGSMVNKDRPIVFVFALFTSLMMLLKSQPYFLALWQKR